LGSVGNKIGSLATSEGVSSVLIVFVAGETGGEIGNLLAGMAYRVFVGVSIDCIGDARAKLSWGVGSGGDMRLMSNWFLRSILFCRSTPEMIVLMDGDVYEGEDGEGSVRE